VELNVVEPAGKRYIEGVAGQSLLRDADDAALLVEACFNHRTKRLLLYPENLTGRFFDLSSREAGTILQKLRTYQIRLAVVWPPAARALSRRFGDLMVEENRDRYFHLFEDRPQAEAWLLED
jgi:hypothetical protein